MIGVTLSHYRIVEKIGAGGMGEVYRGRAALSESNAARRGALSRTTGRRPPVREEQA